MTILRLMMRTSRLQSNEEAGESEEAPSDEEEDPAKDLFVLKEREDGSHYMKVVCPYCGNMETIEIED